MDHYNSGGSHSDRHHFNILIFILEIMSLNRHCQQMNHGFLGIQSRAIKYNAGLSNLGTIGLWQQIIHYCGSSSVHSRMFSSTLSLYLADALSLGCDYQTCLQTLTSVLWGAESLPVEDDWYKITAPLTPSVELLSYSHTQTLSKQKTCSDTFVFNFM